MLGNSEAVSFRLCWGAWFSTYPLGARLSSLHSSEFPEQMLRPWPGPPLPGLGALPRKCCLLMGQFVMSAHQRRRETALSTSGVCLVGSEHQNLSHQGRACSPSIPATGARTEPGKGCLIYKCLLFSCDPRGRDQSESPRVKCCLFCQKEKWMGRCKWPS